MTRIEGVVEPGFEEAREAFAANFDRDEKGAAVAVYVGERCVVDLWGGVVDDDERPWAADTLVNCFSVGKGIIAILALDASVRGEIDLDAPVALYWPEFSRVSDALTVRGVLSHRAGLPAVRRRLDGTAMYDWDRMCAALAGQDPYWEPGSAHGYHVNTFGFLVGEILRRATGLHVRDLLRERLARRLGADFHFGLARDQHGRVSRVFMIDKVLTTREEWSVAFPPTGDSEHDEMIWSAYFNPPGFSGLGTINDTAWREATIPSTNSQGNARGIARLYTVLSGADRASIPRALVDEARRPQSDGDDIVLGRPSRYGLGFQLPTGGKSFGPSASAVGHYGYGGSLGLADPEHGLAFGYCTNKPGDRFDTRRTAGILEAIYRAL